ncbi:proprotein convertase subtilisin/kexin type 6-like isoform X2 [Corticium candelabrum]|uniref:proprotein convertase subtilisin/kexin type 6-like isoform X2 n=1 Tax=Corticium candelabrum TaxID=121492 RepID=UPI002E26B4BC|nr:proprotein convertase subtilisin/kexin type 6-like isoform X2 [Corticium candelabrum]
MAPHYCVRLFFYLLFVVVSAELKATHTNEWAVEIDADRPTADHIARRHGFINMGKITGLDNIYHFERREIPRRMARSAHYHTSRLVTDLKVKWAEQQIIKKRVRRQNQFVMPQDRYWSTQWYLNSRVSTRGTSSHHNVEPVWKQGINGTGVVVSILDDGIQRTHPDIIANYDPKASYDYNSFDSDPYPRATRNDENNHGTRCAGLVATAKNRLCVVGVAFNAKIGGVRMLDGDVTDNIEARSLSHNRNHIDIYSCSWGPDDDGKTVDGPGRLTRDVLAVGARSGRNGLGSIYVWASGNGGQRQDDCGCDGYTNSIYTISVSSVTARQEQPWYLESCASTLISTYSSGYPNRNMVTTDIDSRCTMHHTGTSASTSLMAGIIALAIQANPRLTWRDVQHIVVRSGKKVDPSGGGWVTNGDGRVVSHKYGYGVVDVERLVNLSRQWKTAPTKYTCVVSSTVKNRNSSTTSGN